MIHRVHRLSQGIAWFCPNAFAFPDVLELWHYSCFLSHHSSYLLAAVVVMWYNRYAYTYKYAYVSILMYLCMCVCVYYYYLRHRWHTASTYIVQKNSSYTIKHAWDLCVWEGVRCSCILLLTYWCQPIFSHLLWQKEIDGCRGWPKGGVEKVFRALTSHPQQLDIYWVLLLSGSERSQRHRRQMRRRQWSHDNGAS